MKLEQQVCSLELAKKLKELGVKQESLFIWAKRGTYQLDYRPSLESPYAADDISAFTVAELGEMLPAELTIDRATYYFATEHYSDPANWKQCYPGNRQLVQRAATEANARAQMLIYLLENKPVTSKCLNCATPIPVGGEYCSDCTRAFSSCEHICTSSCRRDGCNCECGEYHKELHQTT